MLKVSRIFANTPDLLLRGSPGQPEQVHRDEVPGAGRGLELDIHKPGGTNQRGVLKSRDPLSTNHGSPLAHHLLVKLQCVLHISSSPQPHLSLAWKKII